MFLENTSFHGLAVSVVITGPVLLTWVRGTWLLGHVMCKLIAQVNLESGMAHTTVVSGMDDILTFK